MKRLWLLFLLAMGLALGVAAPAGAWGLNDSQEPGSVLVFPHFVTGTVFVPDQMGTAPNVMSKFPVTELVISATCPHGVSCPFGTTVNLKAAWICPGESSDAICKQTDFHLKVTVNGTISFDPEKLFDPLVPNPQCSDGHGYLIVWVVDDPGMDNPIKFDSLLGNAVIRRQGLGLSTTAAQYNAVPIQGGDCCAQGGITGDGHLVFDGHSYRQVTGTIIGTVPYDKLSPRFERVTVLRLLTLDVNAGVRNPLTHVHFDFYTPDERIESADGSFYCWFSQPLFQIDSNLTTGFMGTKGLVVGSAFHLAPAGDPPVTLLGVIDTQEYDLTENIAREYYSELSNDSVGVPTIFSPLGSPPGIDP